MRKLMWKPSVVDSNPQVNYSHWGPFATGQNDQFTVVGDKAFFQGEAGYPNGVPGFVTDDRQWYRWRWWYKPATSASANDGATTLDLYRVSDGTLTQVLSLTGIDDYDDALRYRFYVPQNYFGNNTDESSTPIASATNPTSGRGFALWDDPAIVEGTGARRAIYLGDNAVFASCNQGTLAWQPWSVWSGTSRTIRINKGPHASTAGKFLHEVDDTGAVVHSQALA